MNFSKLSKSIDEFYKLASFPDQEKIKNVVKEFIENLKDSDENTMQGVLYASNVQSQVNTMNAQGNIKFVLNLDNNQSTLNQVQAKKEIRNNKITSALEEKLRNTFRGFDYKVTYSEFYDEKPGWFDAKAD
jgi:transcription initiation factor IIE alpha subunit